MVDQERYERICRVFEQCINAEPAARADILATATADDPSLRREIENLLAEDDTSRADLFADPAIEAGREALKNLVESSPIEDPPMPEQIGPYRILREIGIGGMGAVYEAQQDQPKRRVAVKVIKPGMAHGQYLKRFEHEAQVLGQLQHPGIAHIYEAAVTTDDNRRDPYFAMEYINGEPLDSYADRRTLTLEHRLELLARVCDAVSHAHQKGIIHRDLKPNNILVVDESDSSAAEINTSLSRSSISRVPIGQPKILDFGIARMIDPDIQSVTLHTDVGQVVGTLTYMSPEQIAGVSAALDTRCDVYALGVILYELLTGRVPLELAGLPLPEAARLIREVDPPLPSTHDATLQGDVDTIISKAMEKDRERRYGSASELAIDIRRFLNHEPITARPSSTFYQIAKFARRNRGLVGGLITTMIAGAIGLAASTYGFISASNERDQKQAALLNEQSAREVSDAVTNFLAEMLAATKPEEQGRDVTVREVLDNSAKRVGERFQNNPPVEARLRQTIGATYISLGEPADAENQLARAKDLATSLTGDSSPEVVDIANHLGEVAYYLGRSNEAHQIFTENVARSRQLAKEDKSRFAQCLANLGFVEMRLGRNEEAQQSLESAVSILESLGNEEDVLDARTNLALLYRTIGQLSKAEGLYKENIATLHRLRGPEHPDTLLQRSNLANIYSSQRLYDKSTATLKETFDIQKRVMGEFHRQTLLTLNNIGRSYSLAKNAEEGLELFEPAVQRVRDELGEDHTSTLFLTLTLGRLQSHAEQYKKAKRTLDDSLRLHRKNMGEDSQGVYWTRREIVSLHLKQEDFERTESEAAQLIDDNAQRYDRNQPRMLIIRQMRAEALIELERFEEAEGELLEINKNFKGVHKEFSSNLLARLYEKLNRPEEASKWRVPKSTKSGAGQTGS